MRVLATTVPSWGHLVPMLGVLNALRDAGHSVSVATHASLHKTVRSFGFEAVAAGMSEVDLLAARLRQWPETRDEPPRVWAPRMFTEIAAPAVARDLTDLFADHPPDLVIAEEGEHGGPAFAAELGVPLVRHGWGSPGSNVIVDHAALVHLDPCPPSLNSTPRTGETRFPVRLEPPRLVRPNAELDAWLSRDRSVAHVSLGTVPLYADAPELVDRIIDVLVDLGLDVVATGTGMSARWPAGRVRVERMVELADVLPRCSLVVCHAGAGTTLAALAHGLPLVLVPRGAPSQERMAEACVWRGAARLAPDPSKLPEVVSDVLGGSCMEQAQQVAREIAAMPSASEVAAQVTSLLVG